MAGANFFNLSPRNTDGKYPGKNVSMLIHMVFKVARTMAPSVIYMDECEKVFLTDKKLLKSYNTSEPMNRIKKEFLKVRRICIACNPTPILSKSAGCCSVLAAETI